MKKRLLASLLSLVMVLTMLPSAALAAETPPEGENKPIQATCTMTEDCIATEHQEGCPAAVTNDSLEVEESPVEDESGDNSLPTEPSLEDQLAELIAALPDPSDITEMDDVQLSAVQVQVAAIEDFASENDLVLTEEQTAALAAVWSALMSIPADNGTTNEVSTYATAITAAGGELTSGEYELTGDVTLSNDLTIPEGAEVTIDLNGHTLTGTGTSSVITVYGNLTLKDSTATGPSVAETVSLPSDVYSDNTFTARTVKNNDGNYTTYYSVGSVDKDGNLTTTYYAYTSGIVTGGTGQKIISGAEEKNGGGGVYVSVGGSFVMKSGQIALNDLTDKNLVVGGETKDNEGAGVLVDGDVNGNYGSFTMNGGAISGNDVGTGLGGGISVYGTFQMSGGIVSGNASSGSGAGIRRWSGGGALTFTGGYICNNTTDTSGSGIYTGAVEGGSHSIKDVTISGNHAGINGGGAYLSGAALKNVAVIGHSCGQDTGGLYFYNSAVSAMEDCKVAYNVAGRYSGGVYIGGDGTSLNVTGGEIKHNKVECSANTAYGGAVYVTSGAALTMNGTEISNNTVENGSTGTARGGAIYSISASKIELTNVTISDNQAESKSGTVAGGAIYADDTPLTLTDCTITKNKAKAETANTASLGGGVCLASGELTVSAGEISKNNAVNKWGTPQGGGIWAGSASKTTIRSGAVIGGNEAASGGGLYLDGDNTTATLENGSITNNKATGKLESGSAPNTARGGGVYITTGATFTMSGGTLSKNSAEMSKDGSNATQISAYGGGVYMASGGTFELSGGQITGNSVKNTSSTNSYGAGVHVFGNKSAASGVFKVSGNPVITGNTKYNSTYSQGTTENVFLPSAGSPAITLTGPLTSGAAIGVTTQTTPTEGSPVHVTRAEDQTTYYVKAAQYLIPDAESVIAEADSTNRYVKFTHTDETYHRVTLDLEHATTTGGMVTLVKDGKAYSTSISADTGYTLPMSLAEPNGVTYEPHTPDYKSASLSLSGVANDVNISITGIPNKYTVTFDANGGKGTMADQELTYDATTELSKNAYTRTDYNFAGWSTRADGNCEYPDGTTVKNLTAKNGATVTLYAVWTKKDVIPYFTSGVQSYKYDGNTKSYELNSDIESFSISYKQDESTIVSPTNVGSYDVVISRAEDETYAAFQQTIPGGLVITAADYPVSIKADKATMTGSGIVTLTVSSSVADITVTGVDCSDSSITVTKNSDGTYSATLPNATATYTFTAVVSGDLDNYGEGPATCTVSVTRRSNGGGGGGGGSTAYTVSVDAGRNGDVTVSPTRAERGDTVTITVDPDEGYELDELIVTDSDGDEISVRSRGDGRYTFTMPRGRVTVEATFVEITEDPDLLTFTDVPASAYYYDAVYWAVENGVTNGTSATTFSPNASCTRAQMVTFLWRAAGSPEPESTVNPFTDVSASAYYYDAVLWAVEQGITNGTSATTFGPDATVTRGQTVTFLWRYDGSTAASGSGFADVASDAYYADAVAWAASEGVTSGTSATTFSPSNDCTRGQIVTFLYRYMG